MSGDVSKLKGRTREGLENGHHADTFFVLYLLVLFGLVVLGFSPTFFFRILVEDPLPLTVSLVVHGVILTGWFALLVAQALLVRGGNRSLHRRVGWFGVGFSVVVVAGALLAPLMRVRRLVAMGATLDMDIAQVMALEAGRNLQEVNSQVTPAGITAIEAMSTQMWGFVVSLTGFAVLFGGAILYRRRPDVHKRLVALSSLLLILPAISRISRYPVLGGEGGPFTTLVVLALVGAVMFYDQATRGRIHVATVAGGLVVLAERLLPIGESSFWQPLFRLMI